jgi:prepilin-type N-terminal cleavage/methylation domain-containing protein
MLINRLFRRTARILKNRGGFTLVELLVVIGIIAILAGVALGPIMTGLKKAKQNAAVQQEHAIGMAMFAFANDNNQLYPDTSNPGPNSGTTGAGKVAYALLNGGYVSDPAQFWISGGTATKYAGSGSTAATSIAQTNISFDFMSGGGSGLSTTAAQYLPLMWNSVSSGTEPTVPTGANTAMTVQPPASSAFQTLGMAVFFCNQSSQFITSLSGTVTMVSASSNTAAPPTGAAANALEGGD